MKRIITLAILAAVIIAGGCAFAKTKNETVKMLPVFSAKSDAQNRVWVGTFQMVWNEFMDNIVKGPVVFKFYKSALADQLNKQEFKKSMISEDSYYTAYGETSIALKEKIEQAIMKKFNEKSEVLDQIDWTNSNRAYVIYAMLKKDFKFTKRFDILKADSFNRSAQKYSYFGVNLETDKSAYDAVKVLFYNSSSDYAIALKSDKDDVILYRTNSNETFDKAYKNLSKKSAKYRGNKNFGAGDMLKVPFMTLKTDVKYTELCGKEIKNTDRLYISDALQTVDFNMSNTGVKLKSEAVMSIMKMSMPLPVKKSGRDFFFNKTFYLFMQENGKTMPYFAVRVEDMNLYKYTGEVK